MTDQVQPRESLHFESTDSRTALPVGKIVDGEVCDLNDVGISC